MINLEVPIMVDFEITNRCQYRCFFCEGDIPNIDAPIELKTDGYLFILKKLADAGVFNVFLTGGEPLLRPDLSKLIRYAFDLGLEPCTSTNLFHLDGSTLKGLADSGLRHLQVSIQGPSDIHESCVNFSGSYPMVIENLRKAVDIGLEVEVVSMGLRENIEYLPSLIREIGASGVKYFRVLRYVPSHRKEMLIHLPPKSLLERYIPEIVKVAEESNIELVMSCLPGLNLSPSYIFEGVHPVTTTCPAGKTEFAILPNGDVYPCVHFKNRPNMLIGNILENSVKEVWNNPKMVMLRELTPANYTGICGQCERKWTCYSARCVAYNLTGNLYGDDLSCYIVREKLGPEIIHGKEEPSSSMY